MQWFVLPDEVSLKRKVPPVVLTPEVETPLYFEILSLTFMLSLVFVENREVRLVIEIYL
ncbi:MAG: hypothetical protein N3G21_12810 [Candidatus Hydrogenedentes bacterium]|nr:hypothetical protein [Candidatus Hydrogenedentota bacterium]